MSKCSNLWRHACMRSEAVRPCCIFEGPDFDFGEPLTDAENLLTHLNHAAFRKLRQDALAGQKIDGCRPCYETEKIGRPSLRNHVNSLMTVPERDTIRWDDLEDLEIFVGDLCNLKCVMCTPYLSTSLRADYELLGWETHPRLQVTADLDRMVNQLPNLKRIKFVGGEPLLSATHTKLIESLAPERAAQITLIYNSNATIWPKPGIWMAWQKFAAVDFRISVDGMGAVNEYVRFPSRWSEVDKNARNFFAQERLLPNFELGLHSTVMVYNVFDVKNVFKWFLDVTEHSHERYIFFNVLKDPSHLSIQQLPSVLKAQALDRLGLDSVEGYFDEIAAFLRTPSKAVALPGEFWTYTDALNKLRGTSLEQIAPALKKEPAPVV